MARTVRSRAAFGGVLAAAMAAGLAAMLPPRAMHGPSQLAPGDVRVVYHAHTRRSDGTGTVEAIAAAARRAGLAVVVTSDHGDGTRVSDPPRYIDGVLVVDGVEISTWAGHYVALGADPSPYPLGGEPDAVVEDVRRLGGFGVVAHPGSTKEGLKWRAWDAPFDGLEWLNADSEWRDRPGDLWRALATYPWRPAETITALLHRPAFELAEWDRLASRRPITGLAAHDAHARLGLRGVGEPYDGWVALEFPAYEQMFRAFSNVVRLAHALSGDAARDATAVRFALETGRVYTVVTGLASSGRLEFSARSAGRSATIGESLVPDGAVEFTFDADSPPSARTSLYCGGRLVADTTGGRLTWRTSGEAGACRAEVALSPDPSHVPWIVTNPIYVRAARTNTSPASLAEPSLIVPVAGSGNPAVWGAEVSEGATATATVSAAPGRPASVAFQWRLGDGAEPYAAARIDAPPDLASFNRVILRGQADHPMRVWIQLRSPRGDGVRWGRSVYFDQTPRQVAVPFEAMLPLDAANVPRPPMTEVTALLVVVDTVHARPGSSGILTLDELWLAR